MSASSRLDAIQRELARRLGPPRPRFTVLAEGGGPYRVEWPDGRTETFCLSPGDPNGDDEA
jgi:hypothetical protein